MEGDSHRDEFYPRLPALSDVPILHWQKYGRVCCCPCILVDIASSVGKAQDGKMAEVTPVVVKEPQPIINKSVDRRLEVELELVASASS